MAQTENAEDAVRRAIGEWRRSGAVTRIQPLTPDASMRRYFRVNVDNEPDPIVAMYFDSLAAPEAGGKETRNSLESYLYLSEFFERRGIPVPRILYHPPGRPLILLEDLGDTLLGNILQQRPAQDIEALYREAFDVLICFQQIPVDTSKFPFDRAFTAATYMHEMKEFTDFFLDCPEGGGVDASHVRVFEGGFAKLAAELEKLPRALAHRDFHSWNLMIDPSGALRVIDFQDALLAPRTYDVAGLLHDRDTDAALGGEVSNRLFAAFREKFCAMYKASPEEFELEYRKVLLQRDLKVTGRFSKLVKLRKLEGYAKWIPGTARRVAKSLSLLEGKGVPYARDMAPELRKLKPELFGRETVR